MKRIIYEYIPKVNFGVEVESNNPNLVTNWIECAESDFEVNYAKALQESYNGEVTVEEIEEPISEQIQSLKTSLSSTDYKIIKCSEAQLLGEELPYDIASLHTERQALRDKINELEQQLKANEEGGAI